MFRKMRITQRIFLLFFTLFIINGMTHGTALAADHNVIIGFHQSDVPSEEKLVNDSGGKLKKTFHLISAISANMSDENITKLKRDNRIAYIVNNTIYKASDEYTSSWGVQSIGSQPVHNNGTNGAGVKIAVLDTGIYKNHEDLANNYVSGYDFVNNDPDPYDDNCVSIDKTCHGTHVSGIIAAEHNGIGVVGVAHGASIYAVKVLNGGGYGSAVSIISGMEWAVANNMSIISMSIESIENNTAMLDAVNAAYTSGILLVAAAGNSGSDVMYPAAYDSVIAVSSIDANDQIAVSSARGPKIELAAPGVNVNSTICVGPGYTCVASGYGIRSGTSMAAPHVTGVAALIFSTNFKDVNLDGKKNNIDVRLILQQTARDIGTSGRDDLYGFGVVNASRAILGIPPVISSPPKIINSFPLSPVDNVAGDSRAFNITTNQTVNVTWYINGTQIQSDGDVTYSQYVNISASSGMWNVTVNASNINGSVTHSWTWDVTSIPPAPVSPPKIINSFPLSPVDNVAGDSRAFNITTDQTVNVTWYINGTQIQSDGDVTYSQYVNISASSGMWNVTVNASNINGSVTHSWTWNVTSIPPIQGNTFNLTLKRTNSLPINDAQRINLSKGTYYINIQSINLTEVDVRVYESGVLKRSLSRDLEFSQKRKYVSFSLKVKNVTVVFIPYGRRGAIGYVTITSKIK